MVGALVLALTLSAHSFDCHYQSWRWDTRRQAASELREVRKFKRDLTPEERGSVAGCTVCEEDQVELRIPGAPPVKVCQRFAPALRTALTKILASGFQVFKLEGYRVGMTRGPVDAQGLRTQFSNHSYGTALDVNPEQNGLYDNCLRFNDACRLIRGGVWRPHLPGGIAPESIVVEALKATGLKWGGELNGRQKDFMHFSPAGD